MGEPMAKNLQRAGTQLLVWNRSAPALKRLQLDGTIAAPHARDVLRSAAIIIVMLRNAAAIDEVLERDSPQFLQNVRDRTIVNMGTTAPAYSFDLSADIFAAGGSYVEAPVSGSRGQAEQGKLVAMLAGDPDLVSKVATLVSPMCAATFACGAVPNALTTKLAVNIYLITMVTGLAEATNFAAKAGLDLHQFRAILDAGPMASSVSKGKLEKLVTEDLTAQAAVSDVLMNARLALAESRRASASAPLLEQCERLYSKAEQIGFGGTDMIGVIKAYDDGG